jgi:hypothetical protein
VSYKLLQIGNNHINHCEDDLVFVEIGDFIVAAVLDGCTNGRNSHFASALTGKLIFKIAHELSHKAFAEKQTLTAKQYIFEIAKALFENLRFLKGYLSIGKYDLLTTIILLVYDTRKETGSILNIGDGAACIDGAIVEFEQNNQPDYLGYHLEEHFDTWYSRCSQVEVLSVDDFSIATDGVFSFQQTSNEQTDAIDPASFLLTDKTLMDKEDMLYLKLKKLEHIHHLKPYDDIGIIRIIRNAVG